MKALVFCACILVLASSSLADVKQKLRSSITNLDDDVELCMEENNVVRSDWYKEDELINHVHEEPGNEEKKRKLGCTIECVLKKQDMMEGSHLKDGKIHAEISKEMDGSPMEGKAHKVARDCLKKAKLVTQECEKGFSLYVCVAKAVHKLERHGEHEREETEEVEEAEQVE